MKSDKPIKTRIRVARFGNFSIHENILNKEAVATSVELKTSQPKSVNYIQGVVKVPAGFNVVKTLEFAPDFDPHGMNPVRTY
jgi:hypothetical protein